MKLIPLMVVMMLSAHVAQAQQCSFHSKCGPGKLCDNGTCRDVESALSRDGRVFWVAQNQAGASDNNPGTKQKPWKTISRAAKRGVLKPGDAVIVRRGTYRETIKPWEGGRSGKRITFAAYPGEEVTVTGADLLNSRWERSGNAWKHAWTIKTLPSPKYEDRGFVHNGKVAFRREMVIVDGKMLKPVDSRSDLAPGTFYVEGSTRNPKAIYMRLPGDRSPQGRRIEVAQRGEGFAPQGTDCNGRGGSLGHYRLIGFTFRHFANHPQNGAICPGDEGSLFEENVVEWTNGTGIKMPGKDQVMRANRVLNNGILGFGGTCNDCLLEYNEASGNNWKNFPSGWEAGGGKFTKSKKIVIRYHLAKNNNGAGVWFDHDNYDNVVEKSVFINNLSAGINLENNTVRTLVRNNVVYGTRFERWRGDGVRTAASSYNIIVHNTFIANEGMGVRLRGGDWRAKDGHNVVYNNLFIRNARTKERTQREIHIEAENLAAARTNELDGNMYWRHGDGENSTTFFFKNDPQKASGFRSNDLNRWRELTQGAKNSHFIDASEPLIENMSSADGWRLVAASQARGEGVQLPSKAQAVLSDIDGQSRPRAGADVGADQFGGAPQADSKPAPSKGGGGASPEIVAASEVNPDGRTFFGRLRVELRAEAAGAEIRYTLDGSEPTERSSRYTGPITLEKITTVKARAYQDGSASAVAEQKFFAKAHLPEFKLTKKGSKAQVSLTTATEGATIYYTLDGSKPTPQKRRYTGPFELRGTSTVKAAAYKPGLQSSNAVTKKINAAALSVAETSTLAGGELAQASFAVEATPEEGAVVLTWSEAAHGDAFEVQRSLSASGASKTSEASFEEVVATSAVDLSGGQARYRLDFQDAGLEPGPQTLRLKLTAANGDVRYSEAVEVLVELPGDYALSAAYPNPFNPRTQFELVVQEAQEVKAEVYNMLGRRVAVLHDGRMEANQKAQLRFDAGTLSSGNYILRVQGEHFTATQTMMLVK